MNKTLRGTVLVLLAGICWGFSGMCGQYLTHTFDISPFWISGMRLFWSAVIYWALSAILRRKQVSALLRDNLNMKRLVLYAIFGVFACQLCYLMSIDLVNAGTATLMEQLAIIVVLFITCTKERRKPSRIEALSVVMALSGAVLVCTQGDFTTLVIGAVGLLWGIGNVFSTVGYLVLPVKLLQEHDALAVVTVSTTLCALIALVCFQPWTYDIPHEPGVFWGIWGMIILGTVFAFCLFLYGVKDCGSVISGLLNSIEPISAIAFSAIFLGDTISLYDFLGCALIVGMICLLALHEPIERALKNRRTSRRK